MTELKEEKSTEYNEDELQPPQWLDNTFFTNIIKNLEPKGRDVKVKKFKITPATVKGDHYASIMFRASVDYCVAGKEDKSKSMIIKTMPVIEGTKKDMLEKFGIFEVEIGMYTQVLPRFEKYLRAIGDEAKLMAPVLYHSLSPHKLIVFEDLVPMGYNMIRGRSANAAEVKAAYAKLAKWHAISHVVLNEEPLYLDEYRHSFLSQEGAKKDPFIAEAVPTFMEVMRNTPELSAYLPKLEKLVAHYDLLDEAITSYTEYRKAPRNDALYVLNHGDYHSKNMMYKYNEQTGELEDVMLVDFQFSHVGPIAIDLLYSLFMLLNSELRKRAEEFLQYYFDVFIATLEKIGAKHRLPSYAEFQEQLVRHKHLELFLMATFMPIWERFARGEISVDEMITDAKYRRKIYEDKGFINELLVLLPKYLKKGYLDV